MHSNQTWESMQLSSKIAANPSNQRQMPQMPQVSFSSFFSSQTQYYWDLCGIQEVRPTSGSWPRSFFASAQSSRVTCGDPTKSKVQVWLVASQIVGRAQGTCCKKTNAQYQTSFLCHLVALVSLPSFLGVCKWQTCLFSCSHHSPWSNPCDSASSPFSVSGQFLASQIPSHQPGCVLFESGGSVSPLCTNNFII